MDIAINAICNLFLGLPSEYQGLKRAKYLFDEAKTPFDADEYPELLEAVISNELFYCEVAPKNNNYLIGTYVRLKEDAYETLRQYGNYINYKNRRKMNDIEILDLVFDSLKENEYLQLQSFLQKNNIEHSKNDIRRLRGLIKHSDLADVNNIDTDGFTDAIITLNGKGYEELANKKYSDYKKALSEKSNNPTINYITHGQNSPIQTGNKSSITYNINNYESNQINEIFDKLTEFIMQENSINTKDRRQIIKDLEQTHEMVGKEEIPLTLIEKILYYGDQFSSIGSFLGSIILTPSGQSAILFLQGLIP